MTTDTVETPSAEQAAAEAAFLEAAQSTGTPIEPPTETPAEKPAETPAEPAPPAEAPQTPPVEEPDVVKLTKAQLNDLLEVVQMKADLQKSIAMRGKLEEGFGTLGSLQQTIKQLQSGGQGITISEEDFPELTKNEFREVAKMLAQDLNGILGKLKPGGGVDVKKAVEDLKGGLLQEAEHRARNAACQEYLDDDHPGWQDLVGLPDANGVMPDTAFRRWAATTYPKEQYDRIFASKNGPMLSKVLDRFKNEQAKKEPAKEPPKPDPKAMERKERVAAAVQPTGLPATGTPSKTEEDEFAEAATATLRAKGLV